MTGYTAQELYKQLETVLNELEQVDGPVALLAEHPDQGGIRIAGQSGAVTYSVRNEDWIAG